MYKIFHEIFQWNKQISEKEVNNICMIKQHYCEVAFSLCSLSIVQYSFFTPTCAQHIIIIRLGIFSSHESGQSALSSLNDYLWISSDADKNEEAFIHFTTCALRRILHLWISWKEKRKKTNEILVTASKYVAIMNLRITYWEIRLRFQFFGIICMMERRFLKWISITHWKIKLNKSRIEIRKGIFK